MKALEVRRRLGVLTLTARHDSDEGSESLHAKETENTVADHLIYEHQEHSRSNSDVKV